MTASQLTSRDNPVLKAIRLVSSGSRGAPKQLVAAEGIRVLEEVNRASWKIEAVVFSEHFGSAAREKDLLNAWRRRGVRAYRIGEKLFESVSSVQTPQGAIALVRVPELSLDSVLPSRNLLILYACGIQDPGNLGTLIRSAAAAGASLACTTPGTVSARNPKALRASAGAFFRLPLVEHVGMPDFQNYCDLHSVRLYRTDARKGVPHTEADLRSPCAILLGNEGSGLAEAEFSGIPPIRIPMAEGVESLNVAMAGSVILFEALRQRRTSSAGGGRA
jgi:TrmH family RNA methyltransferase